jgi:hypothetical protein
MARSASTSPTTAVTAGQARDDDVKEGGDGSDDSLENRGNTIDDGHQAGADGLEAGLDLWVLLATNP